jgi:hypothetical protein
MSRIDPTQPVDDDTAPPTGGVPTTVPEPRDMTDPTADAPGADDGDGDDDEGEGKPEVPGPDAS